MKNKNDLELKIFDDLYVNTEHHRKFYLEKLLSVVSGKSIKEFREDIKKIK